MTVLNPALNDDIGGRFDPHLDRAKSALCLFLDPIASVRIRLKPKMTKRTGRLDPHDPTRTQNRLQPGQDLLLTAPTVALPLVRKIAEHAYKAGAGRFSPTMKFTLSRYR